MSLVNRMVTSMGLLYFSLVIMPFAVWHKDLVVETLSKVLSDALLRHLSSNLQTMRENIRKLEQIPKVSYVTAEMPADQFIPILEPKLKLLLWHSPDIRIEIQTKALARFQHKSRFYLAGVIQDVGSES